MELMYEIAGIEPSEYNLNLLYYWIG